MTPTSMPPKTLVLIADGNVQRGRTLADHLENLGCEVALASSGHQAHRYAAARKTHAIVADWGLPDMNGLELARQVTLGRLGTKVVLLRDDADWPSLRLALDCGAEEVLSRPCAVDHLLRVLQRAGRDAQASTSAGTSGHLKEQSV